MRAFDRCANRLASEKSPYLIQHSRNPVSWWPWGDAAFDEARRLDVPVFVSVGYSACHWCHVMAEESFENETIARLINENFIPIKVDREERPDLDNLFIKAVTAITGNAGWPLNVFLTPDRQPFFGGTYFPPHDREGVPAFSTVLDSVSRAWKDNRRDILESGEKIMSMLTAAGGVREKFPVDESLLHKGFEFLKNNFDPENAGFGTSPKFPIAFYIRFLLRYHKRYRDPFSLEMAEKTLSAMAAGGIFDHLAGGFHRYSTDEKWHMPHFEKMLYDQALLSRAYLEAFQATGRIEFASLARRVIDFALTQLAWDEGGFFSSLDADSAAAHGNGKKGEGEFYLWTMPQVAAVLERRAPMFGYRYGVAPEGKSVIREAHSLAETAEKFRVTEKKAAKTLAAALAALRAERETRPWPALDDKILCDWNSLMISSLCLAAPLFPKAGYGAQAQKAVMLILEKMRDSHGRLFHRFREWEAGIPGMLDDYAFFTEALLDLYSVTYSPRYLREAVRTARLMQELFEDKDTGGFFIGSPEYTDRKYLQKEFYDSAVPSGCSAALSGLLRLYAITGERKFRESVDRAVSSISSDIVTAPYSYINLLVPLFQYLRPMRRVLISAGNSPDAERFTRALANRFLFDTVTVVRPWEKPGLERAGELIPYLKERGPVGGKAAAYVCLDGTCFEPVTSEEEMCKQLER